MSLAAAVRAAAATGASVLIGMLAITASFAMADNWALPPPVTFTAEQDHANMMEQLGIQNLRPGASGNENDPDHANYDELLANPYPTLPDPLKLDDGEKVTSAGAWWRQRRPQIVAALEHDVYGRVPEDVPLVTWRVTGRHVGIEGVSRYGKAALVTMAFDPRFAMALIGSSGRGGAALLRRNFGETLENLTGSGEYHWMAGNFLKYGAAKAASGPRNPGDLPVDSHELIALCAPRLVFISYGLPAMGDAQWVDQRGAFMAAVAASPVYRLLGAQGLKVAGSYLTAQMPPVNHGLLDGQLGWRQDDGGHTDAPNMKYFIARVDRFIHYH